MMAIIALISYFFVQPFLYDICTWTIECYTCIRMCDALMLSQTEFLHSYIGFNETRAYKLIVMITVIQRIGVSRVILSQIGLKALRRLLCNVLCVLRLILKRCCALSLLCCFFFSLSSLFSHLWSGEQCCAENCVADFGCERHSYSGMMYISVSVIAYISIPHFHRTKSRSSGCSWQWRTFNMFRRPMQ